MTFNGCMNGLLSVDRGPDFIICQVEMVLGLGHEQVLRVEGLKTCVWVEFVHLQGEDFIILPGRGDLLGVTLMFGMDF